MRGRTDARPRPTPLLILAVAVGGALGTTGRYAVSQAVGATGFCGGYTTFSTAMVEAVRLVREGAVRIALLAAAGHLLLCVGAATAGALIGRLLG